MPLLQRASTSFDQPQTLDNVAINATNSTLLSGLSDMEHSLLHLQRKLCVVKEVAQRSEAVPTATGAQPTQPKCHINFELELPETDKHVVKEEGESWNRAEGQLVQLHQKTVLEQIEEPEAFRMHQEKRARDTIESSGFRAAGFGKPEEKHELRLTLEWLELTMKSKRAMEAAALGRKTSMQNIVQQAVRASSKEETTGKRRESLTQKHLVRTRKALALPPPIAPHALPRMIWDMAGCFMLILDAFTLPILLAWNLDLTDSTIGIVFLLVSLAFWSFDILANFNTGIYVNGKLKLKRRLIAKHYILSWFLFDAFIVCLDVFMAVTHTVDSHALKIASSLRGIRSLRALRAVRLLRLLKLRRLNDIIEEAAVATGRQWLLILVSISKLLVGMLVAAHVLSCLWYAIGLSTSKRGITSWLDVTGASDVSVQLQYLHALQWILTPPAPAPIAPESSLERYGNICMVVFTLIVMGSTLGKFTSALQELNAINYETARKRREIRSFLHSNANSMELTSRIMRFVDHKLSTQDTGSIPDISLISPTLQMELFVNQRSAFLEQHPMFQLTSVVYPAIYASICGAVVKHGYERGEKLFTKGEFATSMVITAVGDYTLLDTSRMALVPSDAFVRVDSIGPQGDDHFRGVRWFAESSVFAEGSIHLVTLRADTFCDAFMMSSRQLQIAVQDSPSCTYMFCEYGKDFLTGIKRLGESMDWESAQATSDTAVHQNQHYMELYPDPASCIDNFGPKFHEGGDWKIESDMKEFISRVIQGDIDDQSEISDELQRLCFELDPMKGSHCVFSGAGEREKAESSCLSILNLVADQYENFTKPQKEARLAPNQWKELQEIILWIEPTREEVHAVIVLLAIRSLGKSKRLVQQLPHKRQRPEAAVIFLIEQQRNVVPSINLLDDDLQNLLIDTLTIHEDFNFAQMMQGENSPANILQLKGLIEENTRLFKFYMLFFLGFMSGLAGGQGSTFMNAKTADAIIVGCRKLGCLTSESPQAIYWSYITERASNFSIPTATPEDLALARLACLSRVQDYLGYIQLQAAWMSVSRRSRTMLVNHFLADGITERAFLLEFLPSCMYNADRNGAVRLPALLDVIVDLLDNLSPSLGDLKDDMLISVDLSDLAEFVKVVKNRFVFLSCIKRSNIRQGPAGRIFLEMSLANWTRCNDTDTDMTALAYDVRQVMNKLEDDSVKEKGGGTPQKKDSTDEFIGEIPVETSRRMETSPRRIVAREASCERLSATAIFQANCHFKHPVEEHCISLAPSRLKECKTRAGSSP